MIRYYIYLAVAVAVAGSIWYTLNSWHYRPIRALKVQVITLTRENKAKDIVINNLSVQLKRLTEQNKVTGFEEYFKGYKDENISNITSSDNLVF